MSATGEATINPDGTTTTTTTGEPNINTDANTNTNTNNEEQTTFDGDSEIPGEGESTTPPNETPKRVGTDPALYLALSFITFVVLYMLHYKRQKRKSAEREAFFADMDGDKFHISLPAAVEEYYEVKEKCMQAGWVPGKAAATKEAANGPVRILAQALMKRCIADIPLVTHIQKESPGMNKLYSQSMCSIKQWKSYQAAETLISQEVEDVRAEADEVEPGWSASIWRQAMQYHTMLKNRNEMEMKQREEAIKMAAKKKLEAENIKTPEEIQKMKEEAAEKAAQELIQAEEKEKKGDKAFKGGMKKGFLDPKK